MWNGTNYFNVAADTGGDFQFSSNNIKENNLCVDSLFIMNIQGMAPIYRFFTAILSRKQAD